MALASRRIKQFEIDPQELERQIQSSMGLLTDTALLHMVDWLVINKGLTPVQAYALSSVAVDLRIGNLVDVPNFAVSAILDLGVFDQHRDDDD